MSRVRAYVVWACAVSRWIFVDASWMRPVASAVALASSPDLAGDQAEIAGLAGACEPSMVAFSASQIDLLGDRRDQAQHVADLIAADSAGAASGFWHRPPRVRPRCRCRLAIVSVVCDLARGRAHLLGGGGDGIEPASTSSASAAASAVRVRWPSASPNRQAGGHRGQPRACRAPALALPMAPRWPRRSPSRRESGTDPADGVSSLPSTQHDQVATRRHRRGRAASRPAASCSVAARAAAGVRPGAVCVRGRPRGVEQVVTASRPARRSRRETSACAALRQLADLSRVRQGLCFCPAARRPSPACARRWCRSWSVGLASWQAGGVAGVELASTAQALAGGEHGAEGIGILPTLSRPTYGPQLVSPAAIARGFRPSRRAGGRCRARHQARQAAERQQQAGAGAGAVWRICWRSARTGSGPGTLPAHQPVRPA